VLIFQLKGSALRVFLLSLAFCVLSGQVFGQPPTDKTELVESAFAALAESDRQASFQKALDAINELIRTDTSQNHFVHAVLIARLLIAVEQRDSLLELDEPPDGLADLISLNSGDLLSDGSQGSGLSFDTEKVSRVGLRSAQDLELKKYLNKFAATMTRGFFVFYRTHFAGDDDLKAVFEKATDDKGDQKRMFNRFLSEFKQLDKKYLVTNGKLQRK